MKEQQRRSESAFWPTLRGVHPVSKNIVSRTPRVATRSRHCASAHRAVELFCRFGVFSPLALFTLASAALTNVWAALREPKELAAATQCVSDPV